MKIGLVGSGGREHALAKALAKNTQRDSLLVYATHINPGIDNLAASTCLGDLRDVEKITDFFNIAHADLVVIGPEVPLISGVADHLRSNQMKVVGPSKAQSRLEGDKSFMRDLLHHYVEDGSLRWRKVNNITDAAEFITEVGQVAVKPLGLTGGKGVRVMGVHFSSKEDAITEVHSLLEKDGHVLLEERLNGEEFSRMAFVSNHQIIPMPVAQDFKYAYDGDQGGMTGGMGAYTMPNGSMPFLNEKDVEQADAILSATIDAVEQECGEEYRGFLYGQFMATQDGVRVIEFNVRLGDPEAINMMGLIQDDVAQELYGIACGKIEKCDIPFSPKASLCKYLVPTAYPDGQTQNTEFTLNEAEVEKDGFSLILASVIRQGQAFYTLGSRVLAIVGIGDDVFDLSARMESLLERVEPPLLRHRKDIGDEQIIHQKIQKMRRLRNEVL